MCLHVYVMKELINMEIMINDQYLYKITSLELYIIIYCCSQLLLYICFVVAFAFSCLEFQ